MAIASINNLDFLYNNSTKHIFKNLTHHFDSSNCYVLCGRNGCGKSTLLELLSGKRLAPSQTISVDGFDPFRNTRVNSTVAMLNNQWGMRTVAYCGYNLPLQSSIRVCEMMKSLKSLFPEREKELRQVLKINTQWRLNCVSEGQRKRIQLYLGLLQPFKLLLLDEITVNLDVIVKSRFMDFLKRESQKGCCVVYVTHIFDGLEEWCDRLLYMNKGNINEIEISTIRERQTTIYDYVLQLFQKDSGDLEHTKEKEDHSYPISSRNAGGYSSGTLINL